MYALLWMKCYNDIEYFTTSKMKFIEIRLKFSTCNVPHELMIRLGQSAHEDKR